VNDRIDRRYGAVLLIVLLSAAAAGFSVIPFDCKSSADYTPNPEAKRIYEKLGAPFDASTT
jgi:hypothetical protein